MTILKFLRAILLSLYWQLPHSKHDLRQSSAVRISRELNRKKEKQKRLKRDRPKLPKVQRKQKRHQHYMRSAPKDARFSDQKRLRRMYRGV